MKHRITLLILTTILVLLEAKPGLLKQEKNEFVYEEETYQPMQTANVNGYTPWQNNHMSQIQGMADRMRQQYNSMMQGRFYTPLAVYPMGSQHEAISWNLQAQNQEQLNEMARKMSQELAKNVNAGQYTPTDISRPDFFVHQAANAMENVNRPFTNGHGFGQQVPIYQNVETSQTIVQGEKVTVYNPQTGKYECVYVNSNNNENIQESAASSPIEIKVTPTQIPVHEESYFNNQQKKQEDIFDSKVEYSEFSNFQSALPEENEESQEYVEVEVIAPVSSSFVTNLGRSSTTNRPTELTNDDEYEDITEEVVQPFSSTMKTNSKLHEEFDDHDEPQMPILIKEDPNLLVKPISKSSEDRNVKSLVSKSKKIETKKVVQNRAPIVFSRDNKVVTKKPSNVMSMLPGKKQTVEIDLARLKEHIGTIMKQTEGTNSSETHFMGMSSRKDDHKHVYSVATNYGTVKTFIEQEPGIGYYSSENVVSSAVPLAQYPDSRKPFFAPQPNRDTSSLTLDSEVESIVQPANLRAQPRLNVADLEIDQKDKMTEEGRTEVDEFGIDQGTNDYDDYESQQQLVETFDRVLSNKSEKYTELLEEDLQQTRQDTYAIYPIHEDLGHLGHAINPENGQKISLGAKLEIETTTKDIVVEEEAKIIEITTQKPGLFTRFGQKMKNFFG